MYINYCLLGESNKCYPSCQALCKNESNYLIKDRYGIEFPITQDDIQTITTIYNSKITSICPNIFHTSSIRIDFLDEDICQMQNIINTVLKGNKCEGKSYTSGNLNRII